MIQKSNIKRLNKSILHLSKLKKTSCVKQIKYVNIYAYKLINNKLLQKDISDTQ